MENISLMPAITRTDSFPEKGSFQFSLNFKEDSKRPSKSCSYTYSHLLNKLYVQPNHVVEIPFSSFHLDSHKSWNIQSFLTFKNIVHRHEVVMRCPNHLEKDKNTHRKHFVLQCQEPNATFCEPKELIFPETKHYVNILPVEGNSFCLKFIFTCSNVCQGGISRRPLRLIFNLCAKTVVVDQVILDVSICACPGRDRKTQEEKHSSYKLTVIKKKNNQSKKRRFSEGSSETARSNATFCEASFLGPSDNINGDEQAYEFDNEDDDEDEDDDEIYTVKASSEKNLVLLNDFAKLMDITIEKYPSVFEEMQKRIKSNTSIKGFNFEKNGQLLKNNDGHNLKRKACGDVDLKEIKKICHHLDKLKGFKAAFWWSWPNSEAKNKEQLRDTPNDDKKVDLLTKYLQKVHFFCYWCATFYNNAKDLNCHCPGSSTIAHQKVESVS